MIRRSLAHIVVAACFVAGASGRACGQETPGSAGNDPRLQRPLTLDECVSIALENNIELRVSRLSREAVATGVGEAMGIFFPEITANANRSNFTQFGDLSWNVYERQQRLRFGTASLTQTLPIGTLIGVNYFLLHDILPPNLDTPAYQVTVGFTQPLLRGAGWRATTGPVRIAKYERAIADTEVRARELFVIQRVKAAHSEVIRQWKFIDINQRAIERDNELLAQSQAKLEAGLATKRDLLSAEIILAQDRGTLVDAQTGYQEALDGLTRALGLRPGTDRIDVLDKDVVLDTIRIDETAWIEKARRDNPTLAAARLQVERNRLAMKVAGNARLPQLDFGLSWTRFNNADDQELDILDNLERIAQGDLPDEIAITGFRGWTTSLTVSYPLGNKVLGSAYRRSRLVHEQSQRLLDDADRQVVLEVRTAMRALRNSVERLAILDKNITGAKDKLEFATVNFQLGRASNLDVTDSQKDLLDAETDYVNALVDYRIQVSRVEFLIGGFE
jgi:outer membrane protein TolC